MAARQDLRVGDTEREAVAASLREHYAQGRLSLEEFNQRLDAVFRAATQGELDQITHDLPHVRTPVVPLPIPGGTGSGSPGGGGGWRSFTGRGGGRRLTQMVGGLMALVIVASLVMPALWHFGWFTLGSRIPLVVIAMVIFRIFMRIFFGRRWGGRRGARYTGTGRSW